MVRESGERCNGVLYQEWNRYVTLTSSLARSLQLLLKTRISLSVNNSISLITISPTYDTVSRNHLTKMAQFTKYLAPTTPNIKQAIDSFTTTLPLSNPSQLEETLSSNWRSLLTLASQTKADEQEHLTIFIRELRNVPAPAGKVEIWGEVFKWENLPLWGPTVREVWDITGLLLSPETFRWFYGYLSCER